MKLTCIAIDDEPRALEIMQEYIEQTPFLSLANSFRNPLKAIEYLKQNTINIIFLDINMPYLTGIQFIKTLKKQPKIILTTAYSEYAVDSYQFDVVDYLLKPIEFDRFLKAANKAYDQCMQEIQLKQQSTTNTEKPNSRDFIFVKNGTQFIKIDLSQVLFIEGSGNYISIQLPQKKLLTLHKMSEIIEELPSHSFQRIHKSYIVQLSKIDKVEHSSVFIGRHLLPISATYKAVFFSKLKAF